MGLDPTEDHLQKIRALIKEKIKIQDFISEEELEELAREIVK
jgi:hypothetical protein